MGGNILRDILLVLAPTSQETAMTWAARESRITTPIQRITAAES